MTRRATVKPGSITRLIKAVQAAGERVREVVCEPDGQVRVLVGEGREAKPRTPNDFDPEFG